MLDQKLNCSFHFAALHFFAARIFISTAAEEAELLPCLALFSLRRIAPAAVIAFSSSKRSSCGIGFHFSCQLRVSAQHFVKLKRSEIVVPAKFGDGTGFLVLSHWFVVLSFDFIFDFSVRIWYNGFGNWSG